ncbi:sugar transferase [Sphingomonas aracearum]|uniref:sugar transferase n=1 Tax=Sphingomonas aracearum TaxID=2283317 RepID=UPI001EF074DF|nr:sugar transferase [Sphingomonas aracearum]
MIRTCDVVLSLVALIFFGPIMVLVGIAVFIGDPGPIFFGHSRVGRGGRMFKCYKFRSMVVDAEARLKHLLEHDEAARAEWARFHKLSVDPRINPLGRFLRLSSLDELPQLWNVLRGDMSLVGPRPVVQAELERYGRYAADYMAIRPGVTGLWQISGRSDTSYRRRIALDIAYARSLTFGLYLKIIVLTVPAVLLARGSR